jgi:hypothetical protein
MSRKLNHQRVTMQKRIEAEASRYDIPRKGRTNDAWTQNAPKHGRIWKRVYLPKHSKETLPSIAFNDPGYVRFLYARDIFFTALLEENPTEYQIEIANQLEAIANRAQHILPPKSYDEFVVVVDGEEVFERVEPVKKGRLPKCVLSHRSRIVKRISELDIAIPYGYQNSGLGFRRMSRCLHRIFFKHEMVGPSTAAYEAWFADDKNFNLSGCRSHVSLVFTAEDRVALKAKYLKSLRQ